MINYENIAFRVIEKEDLEILRKLHNDESTFLNLLNIDSITFDNRLKNGLSNGSLSH